MKPIKSQNHHAQVPPLLSDLDRRRLIPVKELSVVTGYSISQLREYAKDGTIPGARQAGHHKRLFFERELLEAWWQQFNQRPVNQDDL